MTRKPVKGLPKVMPQATQEAAERPPAPKLDRAVQARIGEQLRLMYQDLADQPIPDRILDLIRQFEERDKE